MVSSGTVWHFRIILIRIRIKDVKKNVTNPDPGQTLILIRIRIQQKSTKNQDSFRKSHQGEKLKLFSVLMASVGSGSVSFDTDPDSAIFLYRSGIQGNDPESTDPDPPHWTKHNNKSVLTNIKNSLVVNHDLASEFFCIGACVVGDTV